MQSEHSNRLVLKKKQLRLVLIGKTGSGKSTSGNTILGRNHFPSKLSATSVTKSCNAETSDYRVEEEAGRRQRQEQMVVDLPGFGNTHLSEEQIIEEVTRCLALSAPGPHAFLLTVPLGRFTEEDNAAATIMAQVFGEVALRNHTVVLFTRGDELEEPIEEFLASAPPSLKSLIDRCGGRYHVFNNRQRSDVKQVHQLMTKVDQMVHDGGCYTNAIYQELEAALQEENRLRRRRVPEKGGTADDVEENRRRRRRDPKQRGRAGDGENPAPSSSSGGILNRVKGLISPSVLQKVKVVVAGAALGLVCGAAVPVAFVAGPALVGFVVCLTAAPIMVGAAIGALVGATIGAVAGERAASPEEGLHLTVTSVGELGAAVGLGVLVGGVAIRPVALTAWMGFVVGMVIGQCRMIYLAK